MLTVIICYFPNCTVPVHYFPYLLVIKTAYVFINFPSDVGMMNDFVTIKKAIAIIIKKEAFAYF